MVTGDIVEVKGGDRIPADIRIVSSFGFKVGRGYLQNTTQKVKGSILSGTYVFEMFDIEYTSGRQLFSDWRVGTATSFPGMHERESAGNEEYRLLLH